jgi:prepilin-type N-terminal cleavage/methylation domain-containing protein
VKQQKGFTLIELLIVVAIIGIIAAIAIPNLLSAIQRGRQKRAMGEVRSIATAAQAYSTDASRWELDLPDDPVLTLGDEARLHQVLANLLANARPHTRPGTMVSCRLRATASTVVLTVTDNGAGIPDHLQLEIFHRFVRGDSSRSRAAGSTGLGLAIVAAVVAAHHGTVSVQSRPGLTSFTVELPMMQARSTAGDLTLEQALGASDRLGLGSPAPAG